MIYWRCFAYSASSKVGFKTSKRLASQPSSSIASLPLSDGFWKHFRWYRRCSIYTGEEWMRQIWSLPTLAMIDWKAFRWFIGFRRFFSVVVRFNCHEGIKVRNARWKTNKIWRLSIKCYRLAGFGNHKRLFQVDLVSYERLLERTHENTNTARTRVIYTLIHAGNTTNQRTTVTVPDGLQVGTYFAIDQCFFMEFDINGSRSLLHRKCRGIILCVCSFSPAYTTLKC